MRQLSAILLAEPPKKITPSEERVLARVSKDEWHQWGLVVRDGAARLLTMRV